MRVLAAAGLAAGLLAASWGCVHEVVKPLRESTLMVARTGDTATLEWLGQPGMYYSVMWAPSRSGTAKWSLLPQATNLRGVRKDQPMKVEDRIPGNRERVYRLVQDKKPLMP
jgi:hypothetical protein